MGDIVKAKPASLKDVYLKVLFSLQLWDQV